MNLRSSTDTEDSAFLQTRICKFSRLMTLVNFAGTSATLFKHSSEIPEKPTLSLELWGCVIWLAPWLLLRRGAWSTVQLRILETSMLLVASLFSGLLGRQLLPLITRELLGDISMLHQPELNSIAFLGRMYTSMAISLGMAMVVISRAGFVPSHPRYTAILTGTCILSMTAWLSIPSLSIDPPGLMHRPFPEGVDGFLAGNLLVWGGLVTAVSTAVSATVYGLHREVHRARRLGQYELEDKLGEGGMGVVYRASHAMMRRPTAVKLLKPGRDKLLDLARFEREVQQTARLSHPNTITIYDYGRTRDGIFYYSMELLRGATLQRVGKETGALPAPRVLHILRCLAGALAEAHAIELIHRDIKPANIFLAVQGGLPDTPKLLDFGLVKQLNQGESTKLTQAQSLAGTPLYMAPESISDPETVDGRSDLYALGAVAYFMLAGRPVFEGKTAIAICGDHLHTLPAPLGEYAPDLPAELETIVMACLEKKPSNRPQTAGALLAQLDACPQAHAWTPMQAKSWWKQHATLADRAPASATAQSSEDRPEGDTLLADLSGRALKAQ